MSNFGSALLEPTVSMFLENTHFVGKYNVFQWLDHFSVALVFLRQIPFFIYLKSFVLSRKILQGLFLDHLFIQKQFTFFGNILERFSRNWVKFIWHLCKIIAILGKLKHVFLCKFALFQKSLGDFAFA